MIKKKKEHNNDKFKKKIIKHKDDLPTLFEYNHTKIESDSWFNIDEYESNTIHKNVKINTKFTKKTIIKCQKVKMILTPRQKKILHNWFDAYTEMYNKALMYVRRHFSFAKHEINRKIIIKNLNNNQNFEHFDNFRFIRDHLKRTKKRIITKSGSIQAHTLDYAIKQLCSNIKSAKTNLIRGNIKRFRLKFWRQNRCSKTIVIENCYILRDMICPNILGEIKYIYNKKDFKLNNIKHNVNINYNNITKEYSLLIPHESSNRSLSFETRNLISLDPGLRTFMTGVNEDNLIKIGNNVNRIIEKSIIKENYFKTNDDIPNKIKNKNLLRIRRKIKDKVDDLHWKTIQYLITNYKMILLGDMSAKDIVKRNSHTLNGFKKDACLRTRYHVFQTRLQNKCEKWNVNFKLIDESYTSKTCSYCSHYDPNLGASLEYNCSKCKKVMDRDANGARNIYIKNLL